MFQISLHEGVPSSLFLNLTDRGLIFQVPVVRHHKFGIAGSADQARQIFCQTFIDPGPGPVDEQAGGPHAYGGLEAGGAVDEFMDQADFRDRQGQVKITVDESVPEIAHRRGVAAEKLPSLGVPVGDVIHIPIDRIHPAAGDVYPQKFLVKVLISASQDLADLLSLNWDSHFCAFPICSFVLMSLPSLSLS